MREAISLGQNPGVVLEKRNVKKLQSAAYLWHSAFNRLMLLKATKLVPSGLAVESIERGEMLWKLRPKCHKFLGLEGWGDDRLWMCHL